MRQIIERQDEVIEPFVRSMFHEARYELGLVGRLSGKPGDNTDYNSRMSELQAKLDKQKLKASAIEAVALKAPAKLSNVTDNLLEKHIPNNSIRSFEANANIFREIGL